MKYDGIIFDLDDTLWDTSKSYIYALEKYLFAHPEHRTSAKCENLKKAVGVTMDEIAQLVFPGVDKGYVLDIMNECLEYACEYLEKEMTIFPEVIETIKKVSQDYPIFIISDGPESFYEIFLKKSQLTSEVSGAYILGGWQKEDKSKQTNLEQIITKHNLKCPLYLGDHIKDYQAATSLGLDYCQVGISGHTVSEYKYYIERYSELNDVLKINEILQDVSFYQVFSKNNARVVLMENNANPLYKHLFGFLKVSNLKIDNQYVFDKMEEVIASRNIKNVVGPIDYCTWFKYRLPLNHFDLEIYPDISGTQDVIDFLEENGYQVFEKYKSTISTINKPLYEKAKKVQLPKDMELKVVSGKDAYNYVDDIFMLSKKSFKEAFLYTDVSQEVFKKYYLEWINNINPELVLIYLKTTKQLVAFSLAYQNIDKKMYVSKTVGIDEAYQHRFLIYPLITNSYSLMEKNNIDLVAYHYQSVKKDTLKRLRSHQELVVKYYGLFKKEF